MEEINLKDLFNYFLEKIIYIIIITLLVVGLGISYVLFIQKPIYKSSTTIILTGFSSQTEDGATINTNDLSINQKLVTTYQQIATSRKVLNQVIEELDLKYSVEELADMINVSSVTNTEIIKITVSSEKGKLSYKITKSIAKVFSKEVSDLYKVSNVSILDEAEVPKDTSNMSIVKIGIISFVLGLAISFVIVFIFFYFDTTIKTVEQIEAKFDVPILGTIPDFNQKIKGGKK